MIQTPYIDNEGFYFPWEIHGDFLPMRFIDYWGQSIVPSLVAALITEEPVRKLWLRRDLLFEAIRQGPGCVDYQSSWTILRTLYLVLVNEIPYQIIDTPEEVYLVETNTEPILP